MSGQACLIIIRGNKSQANATSASTEQIVDAMTPVQMASMINLLDGFISSAEPLLGVSVKFKGGTEPAEEALIKSSRFVVAAAASICEISYEFLTPAEQQAATEFMDAFNVASDTLLAQIAANT